MKMKFLCFAGFVTHTMVSSVSADTTYSGLLDIAIPTDFTGVTVNINGGSLNPFFGGVGVANNNLLQPLRNGIGNLDTLRNLAAGTVIDATSQYLSTGFGGSEDHVGSTFTAGQEGYIGFKLNNTDCGWIRVVFTNNTGGALIKDWAYDNGSAIATGNVLQSGSTVTLDSASGSFTLGSPTTGAKSIVKTGANTVTLSAGNTYSGTTTVSSGRLTIASTGSINGTSGIVIGAGEFNNNSATALSTNVTFSGSTGTLSGTGTITPAVTITSGNRQTAGSSVTAAHPTATVGKQTFSGGISFSTGSIFEWNLTGNTDTAVGTRGTNFDAVDANSLSGAGGAIFRVILNDAQNFSESFWDTDRAWAGIFKNGGTALDMSTVFSGGFEYQNSLGTVTGVTSAQGAFTFINGGTDLKWTAVPEPTGALAGLLITGALLRRRRACA